MDGEFPFLTWSQLAQGSFNNILNVSRKTCFFRELRQCSASLLAPPAVEAAPGTEGRGDAGGDLRIEFVEGLNHFGNEAVAGPVGPGKSVV